MKIILFDGVCNLCNGAMQFVIKHDKKDVFRFVALQSKRGAQIKRKIGYENENLDSFILVDDENNYFIKSSAAIEIARNLGGIWIIFLVFKIIPIKCRDLIYDFIARNRYKWFGKKDNCLIPTLELKSKFLE